MNTATTTEEPLLKEFPKMPYLRRGCVVTEKIDGTNSQAFIRHLRLSEGCPIDSTAENAGLYKNEHRREH